MFTSLLAVLSFVAAHAEEAPPAPTPTPTPVEPAVPPAPAPVGVGVAPTPVPPTPVPPTPAAPATAAPTPPEDPPDTFSGRHATPKELSNQGVRHGVRTGYVYANNAEKSGMLSSPHLFAIGYEAEITVTGDKWLDFIIVPNVLLLGLNQGVVLPSASAIIGLSLFNTVKFGVGANFSPSVDGSWVHMVAAAEVVSSVGKLQLPVAVSFIPSEAGDFRIGLTVGVNWPKPE